MSHRHVRFGYGTCVAACAAAAVFLSMATAAPALAQDAVQWTEAEGGNGHWYKGVPGYSSWQSAQNSAVAAGGHLATATNDAENMFIMDVRDTQVKFGGAWIGLLQDPAGAEPGDGWMWVTGEPLDYTNWRFDEPNNTDNKGNESDYVEMCCDSPDWGDWAGNHSLPSIIEWSADCNGDGIVDYGQILDGTLNDTDANGVPDCCDNGECGDIVGLHQVGYWVQAEDYNGEIVDRYVVDLYLVAETNYPEALNVYNLEINLGCTTDQLGCYWHAPAGQGWLPNNLGRPFDSEAVRRADSFVTIGGTGATTDHPDQMGPNGTGLDPNFGGNDSCTPGIPGEPGGGGVLAGWYNSNPTIPIGVATNHAALGSNFGVFIGRFSREQQFEICGMEISVTWNYGLGTDGHQTSLISLPNVNCDDDDGDGVANCNDQCPGFDDNIDADGDGIPDECDPCPNWPECSNDGQTLYVQVPRSIQAAIEVCPDGGTIKVHAGDYPEWIDLGIKNLVIESFDGAATTFIGSYDADTSIVRIVGGQTSATELRGFTIHKGRVGSAPDANPASLSGGGLYVFESNPLIEDCTFTDNITVFGGGCFVRNGGAEIRGCTFDSNTATSDGGGLQAAAANVQVENCLFDDNLAGNEGGGAKVVLGHTLFEDCTFVHNNANEGGGVYWFSENNPNSHSIEMVNCSITMNIVSSSGSGGGIRARYGYTPVVLSGTTVCNNTPDQIYGPIADMGGNTLCICPADFNNDGTVDGGDLGILLGYMGSCTGVPCFPDLNYDGVVNGADLGLLLSMWGPCTNP